MWPLATFHEISAQNKKKKKKYHPGCHTLKESAFDAFIRAQLSFSHQTFNLHGSRACSREQEEAKGPKSCFVDRYVFSWSFPHFTNIVPPLFLFCVSGHILSSLSSSMGHFHTQCKPSPGVRPKKLPPRSLRMVHKFATPSGNSSLDYIHTTQEWFSGFSPYPLRMVQFFRHTYCHLLLLLRSLIGSADHLCFSFLGTICISVVAYWTWEIYCFLPLLLAPYLVVSTMFSLSQVAFKLYLRHLVFPCLFFLSSLVITIIFPFFFLSQRY